MNHENNLFFGNFTTEGHQLFAYHFGNFIGKKKLKDSATSISMTNDNGTLTIDSIDCIPFPRLLTLLCLHSFKMIVMVCVYVCSCVPQRWNPVQAFFRQHL